MAKACCKPFRYILYSHDLSPKDRKTRFRFSVIELSSHNFPPPHSTCHLPSLSSLLSQERQPPSLRPTLRVPLLSVPPSQEVSPWSSACWSGLSCVLPGALTQASASQSNMTFPPPHSSTHVPFLPRSLTSQRVAYKHIFTCSSPTQPT